MSTVELKSNLHQLIDGIENPDLLQALFDLLNERKQSKKGRLWESLTKNQQEEILSSYEDSLNKKNLIPHSQILKEFE